MNIRVLELFAGVGGFRVGFERANKLLKRRKIGARFDVVWSNQWEPGERAQYASQVYRKWWPGDSHSNVDIATVDAGSIPDADLLVGGFPCQDYSVARTLNQAAGIVGKKGVLWWEIHRIVQAKHPPALLLENVDRLLKSPAAQRGRDFAIILSTLNRLGYIVEWRVINAADYGHAQRRRRIFILAYTRGTRIAKAFAEQTPWAWVTGGSVLANAFRCRPQDDQLQFFPSFSIDLDPVAVTETFNAEAGTRSPFQNAGVAIDGTVCTFKVLPVSRHKGKTLRDVLLREREVPDHFRIPASEVPTWAAHKGGKSIKRKKRNGVEYTYDEGPIPFPDSLDRPSRTIVTGEGGRSPSRFKHVVETRKGHLRRLTPIELERLNEFPDNHTDIPGISESRRAFFMGNALVTGIVTKIAIALAEHDALGKSDESFGDDGARPRSRKSLDGAAAGFAVQGDPYYRVETSSDVAKAGPRAPVHKT